MRSNTWPPGVKVHFAEIACAEYRRSCIIQIHALVTYPTLPLHIQTHTATLFLTDTSPLISIALNNEWPIGSSVTLSTPRVNVSNPLSTNVSLLTERNFTYVTFLVHTWLFLKLCAAIHCRHYRHDQIGTILNKIRYIYSTHDSRCGLVGRVPGPEVRVRFPALSDFPRSSGSGTGFTQTRENWGATWKKQ
jgi:hypothetical protein